MRAGATDRREMQTPTQTQAQPQTQTIAEARELLTFATRCTQALREAGQRLPASPELADERTWLAAAVRRVERQATLVVTAIAGATALPEFEAERRAQGQALFEAWVDTAESLLVGISSQVSANSPLIEVLFPHQKFDRLRSGGASARAYMGELERRRRTGYVVRLAGEPEYVFLRPLLARFDEAKAALEDHEQPIALSPDELQALRQAVLRAADALRGVLHQARLLADAALAAYPGWLGELGLDARPKKRAARAGADLARDSG
jgi:hypothetical protein